MAGGAGGASVAGEAFVNPAAPGFVRRLRMFLNALEVGEGGVEAGTFLKPSRVSEGGARVA